MSLGRRDPAWADFRRCHIGLTRVRVSSLPNLLKTFIRTARKGDTPSGLPRCYLRHRLEVVTEFRLKQTQPTVSGSFK
jgi:hypothetical protein